MVRIFTCFMLFSIQLVFGWNITYGQVITGTLTYTQTVATAVNANNAGFTVMDASGFAIGDQVLVIQMKGAIISTANSSAYGNVTDYNGAGSFEVSTLCDVSGNDLTFDQEFLNSYDANGVVQIIKIPQYNNLTISGTLTSPAWNGTTGGVLVLEAVSIDLLGEIDMDGKGFRAGAYENSTYSCNWFPTSYRTDFYYDNPGEGAKKGEGIAHYPNPQSYGKGPLGNGGGGGNDHNSGGGGGGNGTSGGAGGTNGSTGFFDCKGDHPGLGGKAQATASRLFLGGGGGAGHGNNGLGTSGGNGGGIIILIAESFNGSNGVISSEGVDALNTSYDANDPGGDGAGGGGSGGTVYLDVETITGITSVDLDGGIGGSVVHTEPVDDCFGPGGGGAGGVLKLKNGMPGGLSVSQTGGAHGINDVIAGSSSCLGSGQGSVDGTAGLTETNQGSLPRSVVDYTGCDIQLAVNLIDFRGKKVSEGVLLEWNVASESPGTSYFLEKSFDGLTFEGIHHIDEAEEGVEGPREYSWLDREVMSGTWYYRLIILEADGVRSESRIIAITARGETGQSLTVNVLPNPVQSGTPVQLEVLGASQAEAFIEMYDQSGKRIWSQTVEFNRGRNLFSLIDSGLGLGVYAVVVRQGQVSLSRMIIVQ